MTGTGRNTALRRFAARVKAVRSAVDTFDYAGGFARGFLARRDRAALDAEISMLIPAMLAVRADDRRRAAEKQPPAPDYKEIACIFGTALGTALLPARGYSKAGTLERGASVDAALREIFKIEVDKTN